MSGFEYLSSDLVAVLNVELRPCPLRSLGRRLKVDSESHGAMELNRRRVEEHASLVCLQTCNILRSPPPSVTEKTPNAEKRIFLERNTKYCSRSYARFCSAHLRAERNFLAIPVRACERGVWCGRAGSCAVCESYGSTVRVI